MEGLHLYESSCEVARVSKNIAWPLSCAQATLWAAYAMHRCEKLYKQQSWAGSHLGLVQQTFSGHYPVVDFYFWVMYGSWSKRSGCGSFFFFDEACFREHVYKNAHTPSTPALLAVYRRRVPTDPLERSHGQAGVSSRWWHLPRMYRLDKARCNHCPPTERMKAKSLARLLQKDLGQSIARKPKARPKANA